MALTERRKGERFATINSTDTHAERHWLDPDRVVLLEGLKDFPTKKKVSLRRAVG